MTKFRLIAAAPVALAAGPALAHHPLDGMPMETFAHGMLSGVGHPVLGLDHLAFVVLAGIAAAMTRRPGLAPLGYVGGMLAGCLLAMAGLGLPLVEAAIALSLVAMGWAVVSGRAANMSGAMIGFGAFGLFHGAAFAGAIVGQEAGYGLTVAMGYLIGLGAIQYAIAAAAAFATIKVCDRTEGGLLQPRLAGAAVAGIGVFLLGEQVEGVVLSAIGLA